MQTSKLMNSLVALVLLSGASIATSQAADLGEKSKPAVSAIGAANAAVSDDVITSSAKAALSTDAQSAALPISVTTKKGVVILSGDVPSAAAGDRVVQIIASVSGVKEVKNDLKVKSPG